MSHTVSARTRGLPGVVLLGVLVFGAACQERGQVNGPDGNPALEASSSSLPHINNTNLTIPTSVSADIAAYDCSNNPGPYITISGLTALGGFGVEIVFSNNLKSTHEYTADNTVDATALPAGEEITLPKQPVYGGVGGNPYMGS